MITRVNCRIQSCVESRASRSGDHRCDVEVDEVETSRSGCTYNLAFFLGPGLPRGLGSPSGPNTGPALLFTPFFLTPSVGGGIDEGKGTGVPAAAGVLAFDSEGLSPFELGATGCGFEMVDDDSFEGDSSLTGAAGSNLCRALGDTFNVTIMLPFEDFRRATVAIAGLLDEAIVELMVDMWVRWRRRRNYKEVWQEDASLIISESDG